MELIINLSRYDFDCFTQDQIWEVLASEVQELSLALSLDTPTARGLLNYANWNASIVINR